MQPLYQIPGEMLREHVARLLCCARVANQPPRLHALLFLSGLRVAFRYYTAAMGGDEFMTRLKPTHPLDDRLSTAAQRSFATLMKRARSRDVRETLALVHGRKSPLPKWPAVSVAFVGFFDKCPSSVKSWTAREDAESNQIRLACAMGIESLWHASGRGFIHGMMREPFDLDRDEVAVAKAFELTRETALPEL